MNNANFFERLSQSHTFEKWLRESGYGFAYWLMFLLVLEPDNFLRASRAGHPLGLEHEVFRIIAAALLGALVTPALLGLTRRFPILGPSRWRHILLHSAGAAGLALALIVASCILAAWGFYGEWLPSTEDVWNEFVSNWLLLVYALCALTAIAHAVYFFYRVGEIPAEVAIVAPAETQHLLRVAIKTRGHQSFLDIASVDWIETQGNYLALHAGAATHLIRETSLLFETRLDPGRFVRIHRRVIVAIDRIRDLRPVANGDADLRLFDGQTLRVSRNYRKSLAGKWHISG
jgi:hypothetical protein